MKGTRIYFTAPNQCLFLGRNGAGRQNAVDICQRHAGPLPVVELVPVTSKDKPARAYQEIPLADVPAVILALQTIYEETRHLIGAPPLTAPPAPFILCLDVEMHKPETWNYPDTPEGLSRARADAQAVLNPGPEEQPAAAVRLYRMHYYQPEHRYVDPGPLSLEPGPNDTPPTPPSNEPTPPAPSVLVLDITYNATNESKRAAIFPDTPEGLARARWTAEVETEPAESEDDAEPAEYCELFRCTLNKAGTEYSEPDPLPLTEPEPTTPTGSPSEEQTDHTQTTANDGPGPEPTGDAQPLTPPQECYMSPAGVVCITLQDDDPRTHALILMTRALFRAYDFNDRPLTMRKYGPERCFWIRKTLPCVVQLGRMASRNSPHAAYWADRIGQLTHPRTDHKE